MADKSAPQKIPWGFILIFLLLAIGIGVAGYFYFESQKEQIRKEKQDELSAVAELKANQISRWRREQVRDAEAVFENTFIIRHLQQFLVNPTAPAIREEILSWMLSIQKLYNYKNVFLLDRKGNILLSIPDRNAVVDPCMKRCALKSIVTGKVELSF
jgi:sensor domain CHASE-containing protein